MSDSSTHNSSSNDSLSSNGAKLYIVATPIGNLDDFSFRAIEVLKSVSVVAAEDTRHSKKLLQNFQIDTPLISHHDFSNEGEINRIMSRLEQGQSIALISDAGTPLISDPGYKLVSEARRRGMTVLPVPGASALTAALSVSGLPTDRFAFEGFLPARQAARCAKLQALKRHTHTLIFYESPHRIVATLEDMTEVFGTQRKAFIGRELTKKFESHCLDELANCLDWVCSDSNNQKGEFVIVVSAADELDEETRKQEQALKIVRMLSEDLKLKKAVSLACQITGARKNLLYDRALKEVDFT